MSLQGGDDRHRLQAHPHAPKPDALSYYSLMQTLSCWKGHSSARHLVTQLLHLTRFETTATNEHGRKSHSFLSHYHIRNLILGQQWYISALFAGRGKSPRMKIAMKGGLRGLPLSLFINVTWACWEKAGRKEDNHKQNPVIHSCGQRKQTCGPREGLESFLVKSWWWVEFLGGWNFVTIGFLLKG